MDDRHLPATQQRRQRLVAQGDVARSPELNSAIVFLGLVAFGSAGASVGIKWFQQFVDTVWNIESNQLVQVDQLQATLADVIVQLATLFGSVVLFCAAVSAALNLLQARRVFVGRRQRSWTGSFYQSLVQLFSFDSVFMFFFSFLKIAVLVSILFFTIWPELEPWFQYAESDPMQWVDGMIRLIFKASFATAICLLVFGLVDYGWRRRKYEQRIMMTGEEWHEEIREIQTDPRVTAQRRQLRGMITTRNPAG